MQLNAGVLRRLSSGVGANIFGQVVSIVIQLASLPLFLQFWGAAVYGEWLILSAVPTYFSMADAGMVAVAMNKMIMLRARNELHEANAVFQSVFLLTSIAICVIALPAALIVWGVNFELVHSTERKLALTCLVLVALATVFNGLSEAILFASRRYGAAVMWANTARLLEWVAAVIALALGGSFLEVAGSMLAAKLVVSVVYWNYVRKAHPEFLWSYQHATLVQLKELAIPAISFMAFPVGSALNIQGITLLVGSLFGPVFLATFNTYRTLSRVVVQMIGVFSNAMWPEFSRLYGLSAIDKLQKVFTTANLVALVVNFGAAGILWVVAEELLQLWTRGKIPYDAHIFGIFLLCTIAGGLWHLPRVLLMSTNQHPKLSTWYLGLSVFGIPVAWVLSSAVGHLGPVLGTLAQEAAMVAVTYTLASKMLRRAAGIRPAGVSAGSGTA